MQGNVSLKKRLCVIEHYNLLRASYGAQKSDIKRDLALTGSG